MSLHFVPSANVTAKTTKTGCECCKTLPLSRSAARFCNENRRMEQGFCCKTTKHAENHALLNYFLLTLLALACLIGRPLSAEQKLTGPQAEAAAKRWLEALPAEGIVLNRKAKETGFTVSHGDSAVGRITKFSFDRDGLRFDLAFRGEWAADAPRETLQKNFWYCALDRVPTPGLDLPGWDVRPQTPMSSFEKGVEILSSADGVLKVRVQTKFFALYGRDPSVLVPADAPSPAGSYFQIRRETPLDLTLEAPAGKAK